MIFLPVSLDFSELTKSPLFVNVSEGTPIPKLEPHQNFKGIELTSKDPLEAVSQRHFLAYHSVGLRGSIPNILVRKNLNLLLTQASLNLPLNFSFYVFDGWRNEILQNELYQMAYHDTNLEPGFVSDPDETIPPHMTGGAIDLTLAYRGKPIDLGTKFDEFTIKAHTRYFEEI